MLAGPEDNLPLLKASCGNLDLSRAQNKSKIKTRLTVETAGPPVEDSIETNHPTSIYL